ncbi:MAG: hypothetical protein JNJ57_16240, partial [Saprospiraceae bacterium]|nr:hypothetical protein [Saprospiraceae bacterium]
MRLASFLPMLLLFASPLAAQQNCQIFDLTASVVQFNQNTCEFFVVLDFQHSGTSNQFTVQGNGTNYGMFVYGQSAVVLGPFQSAPNGPAVLEFVVRDAVFLDCSDAIEIQAPVCNPGCAIHDLVVDVGDCDLNALTFWLKLDFTLVGTPVDSFEVFAAGGVHLGTYAIADLPVTVQNVPWSGNAFTGIKVCAIGNPDCCKVVEFQSPNCFLGCGIVDFQVDPSECLTDSTYKAKIDFGLINPSPTTDSFDLFINDQPAGTFGLNQLPLPVVVTTNGGATDVVRVCITDVLGAVCCREKVFDVPPCLAPCSIQGLTVETDSCTSDSTFGLWVNFHVLDSTAVDSFSLWGNGQEIGHFGLNQLPLHLPNFEWNGLIFNTIKVCTGNAAPCCKEIQFLAPDCLPFDSLCEITHLFVETGACTSDSTYKLFLNFNANNPGNGTFIVYANGAVLDTFDLTEAPLFIQNFPWNGGANDVVTVCIGTDVNTPGTIIGNCCKSKEFPVPACLLPCHIFDLQAAVIGDCDPVTNTYPVKINFHVTNPGNDFFDLYVNGQLFGTFPINQLPLEINVPTGNQVDVFKICINDHPDCCISTELNAPNCDDPCSIVDLHVETGDCNADSTYHLTLNFQVLNSNATQFTLFGNGQQIGVFNLNQLPLHIPNFPWDGQGPNDFLKVCLVFNSTNNPCCETLEFPIPDCLNGGGNCEIFDLHVDTGDCTGDSTYVLGFNFGVHNPTSNTFSAWANGQFLGSYNLNQLPVTIQNFPWNGGNNDVLKVCVGSNTSPSLCCEVIEFAVPDCLNGSGDCAIVDLSVITGDCTGDSTYVVKVDFEVINPPGNTFGLWGNGVFYGTYNVNQLPLTIQNFHWNGGTHDGIKVCFVNPNGLELCCKVIEFPVPDCLGNGGNCEIFDLHVDTGDCTSDSSYVVTFNFGVNNAPGNVFGVWANGQFLGM